MLNAATLFKFSAISLIIFNSYVKGQFKIPDVKLEAISPKGLRVSIPDVPGIQLFAFHGKLNKPLSNIAPGEFTEDIRKPINNFWVYHNPDVQLVVGDNVHYWIFVQYQRLGYRKDDLIWTVKELVGDKALECDNPSITEVSTGGKVCSGNLIFEDKFDRNALDLGKWTVEQYIPTYFYAPNYEFNSYENSPNTVLLKDNMLHIQPIARSPSEVRGRLDLRSGCTSKDDMLCYHAARTFSILPPVRSGRITSKMAIKYGRIEVRARLPAGDWIVPIIRLTPTQELLASHQEIWIAYARGNAHFTDAAGQDTGGTILFGGPVGNASEPARSEDLRSRENKEPYSNGFHTYAIEWKRDQMKFFFDDLEYGQISRSGRFDTMSYITFGVSVGGNNDFPDHYKSGTYSKPWKNGDTKQTGNFLNAMSSWSQTWIGDNTALKVDYIKITAI